MKLLLFFFLLLLPVSPLFAQSNKLIKELESKKSSMSYNMTMTKLEGNIDLGDIVGGKDYLTGISMKKPIGRKIWTISSGKEKVVYKLEGET